MRRDDSSPKAYIATIEGEQRDLFQHVRELVQKAAPDAEEMIRYGMLSYDVDNKPFVSLAAQKNHVGLYVGINSLKHFDAKLKGIDKGKSCLRFKKLEQVPDDLIIDLLRYAREIGDQGC